VFLELEVPPVPHWAAPPITDVLPTLIASPMWPQELFLIVFANQDTLDFNAETMLQIAFKTNNVPAKNTLLAQTMVFVYVLLDILEIDATSPMHTLVESQLISPAIWEPMLQLQIKRGPFWQQ